MGSFPPGLDPRHFRPREFDDPGRLSPDLVRGLDEVRARVGFPIAVKGDVRTSADIVALYGPPDAWPGWLREHGSPHEVRADGFVHAVDVVPHRPAGWDGRPWGYERAWRCGRIFSAAVRLHEEGVWPRLGAELADRHVHLDDDPVLERPYAWPGGSR